GPQGDGRPSRQGDDRRGVQGVGVRDAEVEWAAAPAAGPTLTLSRAAGEGTKQNRNRRRAMLLKLLDRAEEILIGFLMASATLVIFVAVAHRYLAGLPVVQDLVLKYDVSWAQELCIYMFVWMAKFGAAYGVRQGIHVGVDVLVRKLPEKQRRPLTVF